MPQRRTIYLDCTATYLNDRQTGIQRVVRNVVRYAGEIGAELGVECRAVAYSPSRGFFEVPGLPTPVPKGTRASAGWQETAKVLCRKTGLVRPIRATSVAADRLRAGVRRTFGRSNEVSPGPGDVLLLLDATWTAPFWPEVAAAKRAGASVGIVVYDLLPLSHPENFIPDLVRMFSVWWGNARRSADFALCISDAVWNEVRSTPGAPSRGGSFPLGTELDGLPAAAQTNPRDDVAAAFAGPAYLMVGTLNPRKGYDIALDAFERLWSAGRSERLVIVGQYGWGSDALAARLNGHPEQGRKLFWLRGVADADLDWCYRNASALLTTSRAEGFNMPIIESLYRGTPVLASDLPVHQEVGGRFASYFRTGDPAAAASAVAAHADGRLAAPAPAADFRWPGWRDCTANLLGKALRLSTPAASRAA